MTADTTHLTEGLVNLAVALAGLMALGRFLFFYMDKVVNRTMDRNEVLEARVEKLELELELERAEHFSCKAELHRIQLESTAEIAQLRGEVEVLKGLVNRPRRASDSDDGGDKRRHDGSMDG